MSKRKRATTGKTPGTPTGEESTDDAAVKDDMVHVTPDMLAGGPDIWAHKSAEASSADEPAAAATDEPAAPAPEPTASEPAAEVEPTEAGTTLTPEAGPTLAPDAPAAPPPPYVNAVPYPAKPRRAGSSAALGFVLFESILGISGRDYFGPVGKAALPALLIIVGVILLVRSVQRSRRT